jgi:LacI family transcriptional regulator
MTGSTSRNPTIHDVARVAAVSLATVSRVINRKKSVSDDARLRVQRAIDALGYERDTGAANMRRRTTQTVAIAIRDFSIAPNATSIQAIEAVLRAAGYTVLLASTCDDKAIELALLREFSERRVDGILMTLSDEDDPQLIDAVTSAKMPIVLMNRGRVAARDCVMPDLRGGTAQATDYLLSLGHRRIALLTGQATVFPARARVEGFLDAYAARSLEADIALIRTGAFTGDFAFTEVSRLLSMRQRPTALIMGGMSMLAGALRALKMAGLSHGQDMSIIAGGDSDLAELASPPITALSWDVGEFGRFCVTTLIERMQGRRDSAPMTMVLPTTLLLRGSCLAPPDAPNQRGARKA